ncbi:hypothetical protein SNE40_008701 [Patella caerulea]|uniref:Sulfotransferase domain-containing protein n=2 Tax=Patella caerulea TaxID=87958 RepID=A0AAN8JS00_PATCE
METQTRVQEIQQNFNNMASRKYTKHYVVIFTMCYVIYFYHYHLLTPEVSCPRLKEDIKQNEILTDPELRPFYNHLIHNASSKISFNSDTERTDFKMNLFRDPRWRSRKPRLKVLLLSYMNSGSTYIGDVIRRNRDVFYVHHPLLVLQTFINENKGRLMFLYERLEVLKKHELKLEKRDNFTLEANRTMKQLAEETIANFLNCNFTALDFASLSNLPRIKDSQTTKFLQCVNEGSLVSYIKCLHLLYELCNKTNINVVNSVQFPLAVSEWMMQEDPGLKVVYLVRDPRATLWTQFNYGVFDWSLKLSKKSRGFCKLMRLDLLAAKTISQRFPNRLLLIRYEDLLDQPEGAFQSIFSFLQMNYTSEIQSYIKQTEVDTECWDCIEKDNNAWRTSMPFEGAKMIDFECELVYKVLGYIPIKNKAYLRDTDTKLEIKDSLM